MDADFSIELGRDDPVLDFPWTDPSGRLAYLDLKSHPEQIAALEEAARFPELGEFLSAVNSPRSAVNSAKCDVWFSSELGPEEEVFGAATKCAGYVDLVFSGADDRMSFAHHEQFAKRLVELLRRAPEMPASAEVLVRRCFFGSGETVREGFYLTMYLNGYGNDENAARQRWAIGMRMTANAILQISAELP